MEVDADMKTSVYILVYISKKNQKKTRNKYS